MLKKCRPFIVIFHYYRRLKHGKVSNMFNFRKLKLLTQKNKEFSPRKLLQHFSYVQFYF